MVMVVGVVVVVVEVVEVVEVVFTGRPECRTEEVGRWTGRSWLLR